MAHTDYFYMIKNYVSIALCRASFIYLCVIIDLLRDIEDINAAGLFGKCCILMENRHSPTNTE